MSPKSFLVVGATGQQGGSTIKALLASPELPPDATIFALSRNVISSKAKALAALDTRVKLLAGDPTSPEAIFASVNTQLDSVYCVTVHGPPGAEEAQAEGLINASLKHGVKHFVFASADRGGAKLSDTNPTPVPHIATKHRIELYLKGYTAGKDMKWTMLRPVTFFENLTPDFAGKGFAAMWSQVGSKPVQMVSIHDIGFFASKAMLHPEEFAGKSIGIAGDELNFEQALKVFKDTMGTEMPQTFCVVGSMVKSFMTDIGMMFKWFEKDGFNVDIPAARAIDPKLMNFATWLETTSGFKKA